MSDRLTTYNPRKVTCALGNHIASGFADDSFITIEPAGDGTSVMVGADGEVIRSVDPNDLNTLKISLLQNSQTNDFLTKKYKQDLKDGTGTFSVNIADKMGGDQFSGAIAWVNKPASWGRGKAATNREWEITVKGTF